VLSTVHRHVMTVSVRGHMKFLETPMELLVTFGPAPRFDSEPSALNATCVTESRRFP
jgi:hypothetical protein